MHIGSYFEWERIRFCFTFSSNIKKIILIVVRDRNGRDSSIPQVLVVISLTMQSIVLEHEEIYEPIQ